MIKSVLEVIKTTRIKLNNSEIKKRRIKKNNKNIKNIKIKYFNIRAFCLDPKIF